MFLIEVRKVPHVDQAARFFVKRIIDVVNDPGRTARLWLPRDEFGIGKFRDELSRKFFQDPLVIRANDLHDEFV